MSIEPHVVRSGIRRALLAVAILLLVAGSRGAAQAIELRLPTSSTALLEGGDSVYYQSTGGKGVDAWRSGTYGYVRNRRGPAAHPLYMRFHEGIDVKPLYRDARGVPLDSVRAAAAGRVVHACTVAGYSNYGKYVVVEHLWHGSPYYSLYAHLSDVWVENGAELAAGDPIGRLGYTGAGINRTRAHLHFEIGLLLNGDFDAWFADEHPGELNRNGVFNGHNLAGVDVPRLYLALRQNPALTIAELLSAETPLFAIRLPLAERPDLLRRYPWLLTRPADSATRSWTISFTRAGLPLCVEPSTDAVERACAVRLDRTGTPCRYLAGRRASAECDFSAFGRRFVGLLTTSRESLAASAVAASGRGASSGSSVVRMPEPSAAARTSVSTGDDTSDE